MKKKSFLVLILICVMAIFASAFAGCNLIEGDNGGNVRVSKVLLSGTTLSLDEGGSQKLEVTVLPADATNKGVSWSTSDPSVATVTQKGIVTAVAEGVATITVTSDDGGLTAQCVVTVSKEIIHVTGVKLDRTSLELTVGQKQTLTASVQPSNASNQNVEWNTDDKNVATVTQSGEIEAVGAGTAHISVTTLEGAMSDICTVTVSPLTPPTIAVTGVTLSKKETALIAGQTETITASVQPADATNQNVTWGTDNASVATVEGGKITANSAGTAHITVTTVDGSKTDTCTVIVTAAKVEVTGVTLNKNSLSLTAGQSETLTATVQPANASNRNVSWSTSNTNVATVTQNGLVTAVSAGTAEITVTTEDGSRTDKCTVSVTRRQFTVTFISDGEVKDTQYIFEGECALTPTGVTKEGYELKGWKEDLANGDFFGLDTPVERDLTLYAVWEKTQEPEPEVPPVDDSAIKYTYAGNECAALEWEESDYSKAKVEYKKSSETSYTVVDKELIRPIDGGKARVDIVGLKGNTDYDFKITTSQNKVCIKEKIAISAYDRSGYAHFKNTAGVGAYNDDGTLKSGAIVVYVTEANKNKVTVDGVSGTGIVQILQNAKNISNPLVVRIIGTVGAATWNKLVENEDKALTPDKVVGINGKKLVDFYEVDRSTYNPSTKKYEGGTSQDITQATLIKDGFNTLNTKVYSELIGLNSKIKYDASKDEFDSCWNDCSIQNVKNVTVEGIGENARIFQWGFTWKNCDSIEIRNLTFDDYTEDACSFEGSETSASDLSGFNHGNFWIHHNIFEEGLNYWDVCNEQDKHDGDGSTDFKGLKNITISYNVYNQTHKTGLIGGGDSHTTANITFHHNAYNGCKARLPLARQANMHMYNNYYNGTTSTDLSLRANAYAFVENCYFESNNNRPVELVHGSSGDGSAKLIGCIINESRIVRDDGKGNVVPADHLYVGNDRSATVVTENKFAPNFENDSSKFYYKNGKSDVAEMLTAEEVKTEIPKVAGVQKRADYTGGSGGSTGGGDESGKVQSGTVVVIDDGTPKAVNGSISGITVEKNSTTKKNESYTCDYNGETYSGSYKLDSSGKVTITLAETKTVRFCFYVYVEKSTYQVSIGGVTYDPTPEGATELGTKLKYFFVEAELEGGVSYDIVRLNGVETCLCYFTIL